MNGVIDMAGRKVIVLGDKTSHDGEVISASGEGRYTIDGIPVACVGDRVSCPKKGHNNCVIIEGDEYSTLDGKPIVLEGCKCSCGAVLISEGQSRITHSNDFVADEKFLASLGAEAAAAWAGYNNQKPKQYGSAFKAMQTASSRGVSPEEARELEKNKIQCDEQLQFVDEKGHMLRDIEYKLYSNGLLIDSGRTDQNGLTSRVTTVQPIPITSAELSFKTVNCCGNAPDEQSAEMDISLNIPSVETNPTDLGSSVVRQVVKFHERPLTANEIRIAQTVFGKGIDYSKVKIHNHGYPLLLGLQGKNHAVAPNGEIYFTKERYLDDFAGPNSDDGRQQWFIHEMVHVWQYQLGYPVKGYGIFRPAYEYTLDANKTFSDYNMEQQGNIVADYYYMKILDNSGAYNERFLYNYTHLPLYEKVLENFLKNPKDKSNLPGGIQKHQTHEDIMKGI
jgi:uncharacterized Zn-binding protein involved in type VI secretion